MFLISAMENTNKFRTFPMKSWIVEPISVKIFSDFLELMQGNNELKLLL